MNAETWFQFGASISKLSQRIPLSRCFLIGIQQKNMEGAAAEVCELD
jgi:hypothetical protein